MEAIVTFQQALTLKPPGLTAEHETVAQILMGRPEGVNRSMATRLSGMPERRFRMYVREIAAAGWLPTVSVQERDGTRVYKITQVNESHLVDVNNREDRSRAGKLFACIRGRTRACRLCIEPKESG